MIYLLFFGILSELMYLWIIILLCNEGFSRKIQTRLTTLAPSQNNRLAYDFVTCACTSKHLVRIFLQDSINHKLF